MAGGGGGADAGSVARATGGGSICCSVELPLATADGDGFLAGALLARFLGAGSDAGFSGSGADAAFFGSGADAERCDSFGIGGANVIAVAVSSLRVALSVSLGPKDCRHCHRKPLPATARMSTVRA